MGFSMSEHQSRTDVGGSNGDDLTPKDADYARWREVIKRVGPGLVRYFRVSAPPATQDDDSWLPDTIYDGLMDALFKIKSSYPPWKISAPTLDRLVFTVAKNAIINNMRKSKREVPELRVYPEPIYKSGENETVKQPGPTDNPADHSQTMQDLLRLVHALPQSQQDFILMYVTSNSVKTNSERQKAHRIIGKLADQMHRLGHDPLGHDPFRKKRLEGGGQ
jgi:DNA-directed RNA polymerase specialized sigma24 family protein